jgi:LysR family nitrogen assimilation transcriptional regulator
MCEVRELLKQGRVSASPIADLFVTWLLARPKSRTLGVAADRFHDLILRVRRQA